MRTSLQRFERSSTAQVEISEALPQNVAEVDGHIAQGFHNVLGLAARRSSYVPDRYGSNLGSPAVLRPSRGMRLAWIRKSWSTPGWFGFLHKLARRVPSAPGLFPFLRTRPCGWVGLAAGVPP